MWLVESLTSGFTQPIPIAPLCLFRVLFGLSCLLKFFVETKRGYYRYFESSMFLYVHYQLSPHRLPIRPVFYRWMYIGKIVVGTFLTLGLFSQIAAILLAIWFAVECSIYFKFHVSFFLLVSFILGLSADIGTVFGYHTLWLAWRGDKNSLLSDLSKTGDGLVPCMLVMTTSALYVFSAIRKIRSNDFTGGTVLYVTLQYLQQERCRRRHAEMFYPDWFITHCVERTEKQLKRIWRPVAGLTIAIEFILPFLLLTNRLGFAAALLGFVVHVGFTFLQPVTLAHFSLATVATYILFLDPYWVASFLRSIAAFCLQ